MEVQLKTRHKVRDIRITFGFFAGIISFYAYRHFPSTLSIFFILAASTLLCFVLFSPLSLHPLFERWIKFSVFLGKINTRIFLILLFVLIFIPTGLIKRLFGKDSMQRTMKTGNSYWEYYEIAGLKDKSRYEKQF